jgi:hypothetical protein
VSYLTEELVRLGHDVTLFASGDSVTTARLEAICAQALRLNTGIFNRDAPMTMLMEQALGKTGHSLPSRFHGVPSRATESDPNGDHVP